MKELKYVFLSTLALTGMLTVARAAPTCDGSSISSLPVTCSFSDLTFTFTAVSYNPVAAGNSLEINGTSAFDGDVTLDFQLISGATPTYR